MILYSQTYRKHLVDQHYKVSVTMVTQGVRGEGGTLNEALQTKSRLQLLFHTCSTQQATLRVRQVLMC